MIYYFYGQDQFLNERRVRLYVEKYSEKYPRGAGLYVFDGINVSADQLENAIGTFSLFGENKLIVVRHLEEMAPPIQSTLAGLIQTHKLKDHAAIFLVCQARTNAKGNWTEQKEEPTELFSILDSLPASSDVKKSTKQCTDLAPLGRKKLIETEIVSRNIKLSPALLRYLLSWPGDLGTLFFNLDKLSAFSYAQKKEITESEFWNLVDVFSAVSENASFVILDALAAADAAKALGILQQLMRTDEGAEFSFWGTLAYFVRTLISIKSLQEEKATPAQIKEAGIKPFVFQKYGPLVRRTAKESLLELHTLLADFDARLKIGEIESGLALEIFIVKAATLLGSVPLK